MYDGLKVCAVVLAAGRGKRMNSDVPKQFMMISGRPVIYYSLRAFEESDVDEIILVTGQDHVEYCREEIAGKYSFSKLKKIVPGGAERYDSVFAGLKACDDCGIVLIHDGARPMINPELINQNIACAAAEGACVTAVPSKDTVKLADEDGYVSRTLERSKVWIIQTPQSFRYDIVMRAYEERARLDDRSITDDAMTVEKYMHVKIKLLMGSYSNIKITTIEDIGAVKSMLAGNEAP